MSKEAQRLRAYRQKMRAQDRCYKCGYDLGNSSFATCDLCRRKGSSYRKLNREKQNQSRQKRRLLARKRKLCSSCTKRKAVSRKSKCSRCIKRQKQSSKRIRQCISCLKNPQRPGGLLCRDCKKLRQGIKRHKRHFKIVA